MVQHIISVILFSIKTIAAKLRFEHFYNHMIYNGNLVNYFFTMILNQGEIFTEQLEKLRVRRIGMTLSLEAQLNLFSHKLSQINAYCIITLDF